LAKRHILSTSKQYKGQYFSTNISEMMSGIDVSFFDKIVIDPFAGNWDMLNYAKTNGAKTIIGYDIEPKNSDTIQNDSLMNPPDYSGMLLFTNPPYLAANKCRTGNKTPFNQWNQNDYYKCHLASLYPTCDEAILILPANFLSESNSNARNLLFRHYKIIKAKYWTTPIFEDTNSTICLLHIKKELVETQKFQLCLNGQWIDVSLAKQYSWLFGKDFFDYINGIDICVSKCDDTTNAPNTNIIIGILDGGSYKLGYHYNDGLALKTSKSTFTTFQISSKVQLTESEQREIVKLANIKLNSFRQQYHSLFLANYMGANQKILSVLYAKQLLSKIISEMKQTTLDSFM
jgi:hypothetical protein